MSTNIVKKIILALSALSTLIFAGCSGLTNLTPNTVPENPSRTYTLSMSAYINDGSIIQRTIEPFVVIDGQPQPMKAVSELEDERFYEFDYILPRGRKDAKYYFLLKYKADMGQSGIVDKKMVSDEVYLLEPVSRYVMSLQYDRGPVGVEVPVLGRGFDQLDKIAIGGKVADTQYLARTTLNFTVPSLEAGKTYDVELKNSQGKSIWIGQFHVDAGKLMVSPTQIEKESGETVNMIFDLGFTAPKGGYAIDVKTNIPSSVIMPEVIVPEGSSSVTVPVKFTAVGKGALYINAVGFKESIIPVSVKVASPSEIVVEVKKEAKIAPKPEVKTIAPKAEVKNNTPKAKAKKIEKAPVEEEDTK